MLQASAIIFLKPVSVNFSRPLTAIACILFVRTDKFVSKCKLRDLSIDAKTNCCVALLIGSILQYTVVTLFK